MAHTDPLRASTGTLHDNGHPAPSPAPDLAAEGVDLDAFDELFTTPETEIELEERDGTDDVPVVGGPPRGDFFQVHPTITWTGRFLKMKNRLYLCAQTIDHPDVRDYKVHLMRTLSGELRLWPIPQPLNGEDYPTGPQQRRIAAAATGHWAAARWHNKPINKYRWIRETRFTQPPAWPITDIRLLVRQAFGSHTLTDPQHPDLLKLPRFDRGADDA